MAINETHKVEYVLYRTGSKLFDIVMTNTAKKLCEDCKGLSYEMDDKKIRVFGELDEENYKKYMEFMFESDPDLMKF